MPLLQAHRRSCGMMHMSKSTWTWYGYLPARGLSQYARNVLKFVRMRRLVAVSLPRTYINCWSELGGHLAHSTPPDRPRQPHRTAGARSCRCRRHFGTLSERHRPEPRLWGSASVCVVPDWYSGARRRPELPQRPQHHYTRSRCAPKRQAHGSAGAVGTCHAERETAP